MQVLESMVREHADAGGSSGSGEKTVRSEIFRREGVARSIYKFVFIGIASLNGASNPPHELHAQEQLVVVKSEAEEEEDDKEKLPVFKTMEEWNQSPILTDKQNGLYAKMSVLNEKYKGARTFKARHPLREETEELARVIMMEIGNPPPPALDTVFLRNYAVTRGDTPESKTVYRFEPEFIRDLGYSIGRTTLLRPFKMLPGEVNGMMATNYIVQATRLPIEITAGDMATRNALESASIKIAKDNKMWQVLADVCNSAKVDMDIAPIGDGLRFIDGIPKIIMVHFGPWSRLRYQSSTYGVSVSGSVVESDGDWSYVSGSDQPESNSSNGNGYWIPQSLCLKCPVSKQDRQVKFSRSELPFKDPETGDLLCFDRKKNALMFSNDPSEEKFHEDNPQEIVWKTPRTNYLAFQEWYQKMAYGMITPPGVRQ